MTTKPPSLALERSFWNEGREVVVGVDEVGRGAWAGPIMVGAAVLPRQRRVYGVRDSKMLREVERERLFDRIAGWCTAWAVGAATQVECDEVGMAEAQRRAARRAIDGLGLVPDQVLVDGNWDFVGMGCTTRIVRGDATCLSIAAASILAKVTRDRLMRLESTNYPAYDFDANKGYPCPRHKMALHAYGPSAIHRRTWVFMENLVWGVAGARATPRRWLPEGPDGIRANAEVDALARAAAAPESDGQQGY
jgi:ribonuclease HII